MYLESAKKKAWHLEKKKSIRIWPIINQRPDKMTLSMLKQHAVYQHESCKYQWHPFPLIKRLSRLSIKNNGMLCEDSITSYVLASNIRVPSHNLSTSWVLVFFKYCCRQTKMRIWRGPRSGNWHTLLPTVTNNGDLGSQFDVNKPCDIDLTNKRAVGWEKESCHFVFYGLACETTFLCPHLSVSFS